MDLFRVIADALGSALADNRGNVPPASPGRVADIPPGPLASGADVAVNVVLGP
jgi:hypothetical protein